MTRLDSTLDSSFEKFYIYVEKDKTTKEDILKAEKKGIWTWIKANVLYRDAYQLPRITEALNILLKDTLSSNKDLTPAEKKTIEKLENRIKTGKYCDKHPGNASEETVLKLTFIFDALLRNEESSQSQINVPRSASNIDTTLKNLEIDAPSTPPSPFPQAFRNFADAEIERYLTPFATGKKTIQPGHTPFIDDFKVKYTKTHPTEKLPDHFEEYLLDAYILCAAQFLNKAYALTNPPFLKPCIVPSDVNTKTPANQFIDKYYSELKRAIPLDFKLTPSEELNKKLIEKGNKALIALDAAQAMSHIKATTEAQIKAREKKTFF